MRLELELLEDRITPDVYLWVGSVNTAFSNPFNWWDNTNNAMAFRPPTSSDDLIFDGNSQRNCILTTTGYCKDIINDVWTGRLEIDNGTTLNIMGGDSRWKAGNVTAGINSYGIINMNGGFLTYSATNINNFYFPTAPLYIYVNGGAEITFKGDLVNMGATIYVGWDVNNYVQTGALLFDSGNFAVQFTNNASIDVSSAGTLSFYIAWVNSVQIVSVGTVNMFGESIVGGNLDVEGGLFRTDDETETINGNLNLTSATLKIGIGTDQFSNLTINGGLVLSSSVVDMDMDMSSLGQCDSITATSITLDNTDTFNGYTSNTSINGDHVYNLISGAISGTFGVYNWFGVVMCPGYTNNSFQATCTI